MNPFREQNNGVIAPDGTSKRLPILHAWQGSSAVYWVVPAYPPSGMQFKVGSPDKGGWQAALSMSYHRKRGMWRVYVPGRNFRGHYETIYRLVSFDGEGGRHVEGEGVLRVHAGLIPDGNDDIVVTSHVLFADGKWRKITVSEDESGAPTFVVGGVATSTEDFDETPKRPYAYNKATGMFHEISGVIDEVGEAVLVVSETPIESGGDATFALDEKTNLYYRLETVVDESGEVAVVAGETVR